MLTNGWDHHSRKEAAIAFKLDLEEMEERHHQIFPTYEESKLTLDDYLNWVIFYKKRSFGRPSFRSFMFAQSKPYPEMIALIIKLKKKYRLKIAVVSNEGKELNDYRIQKFKLESFVDTFVSSCIVHLRKPDSEIFRLALDISHAKAEQVVYIENSPFFVQMAEKLGIGTLLHTDYASTKEKLSSLGLSL